MPEYVFDFKKGYFVDGDGNEVKLPSVKTTVAKGVETEVHDFDNCNPDGTPTTKKVIADVITSEIVE